MSTVDWPDESVIPKPSSIDIKPNVLRYKSSFESGYVQIRRKFTSKSKKKFLLTWGSGEGHHVLYPEHAANLIDFFEENGGSYINWTNPRDNKSYVVVFSEDEISLEEIQPGSGYYRCSITLEEI